MRITKKLYKVWYKSTNCWDEETQVFDWANEEQLEHVERFHKRAGKYIKTEEA